MTFEEIDERYREAALGDDGDAWDEGPAEPDLRPHSQLDAEAPARP